jgi:hypothetical protein
MSTTEHPDPSLPPVVEATPPPLPAAPPVEPALEPPVEPAAGMAEAPASVPVEPVAVEQGSAGVEQGSPGVTAPAAAPVPQARAKTKGVADIVFVVDVSGSMATCIDALRANIEAFVDSLSRGTRTTRRR